MAQGDTQITICGNLVDDPELRFTPQGHPVAKFRVASTPRYFDKQANDYKDGESLFLSVNVWRQQAEHVAESLQRGHRVVVVGRLKQRSYETREGEKRTVYEIEADDVAVSLKNATAKPEKVQRSGGGQQPGFGGGEQRPQADTYGGQGRGGRQSAPPADDPWATSSGQQTDHDSEPPF
jgi:single-strand DNA-binding protein